MASPGGVNKGLITDNDTWSVTEQSDDWIIAKADISYLNDEQKVHEGNFIRNYLHLLCY